MQRVLAACVAAIAAVVWGSHAHAVSFTATDTPSGIFDFPDPAATSSISVGSITDPGVTEVSSLTLFTTFTLILNSNITMSLSAPGSSHIDLISGSTLTPETYANAWSPGNAPDLAAFIGADVSGTWTLSILDVTDNFAPGVQVGTLDGFQILFDVTAVQNSQNIPEPAALAIFGFGLAGIGWIRRRAGSVK